MAAPENPIVIDKGLDLFTRKPVGVGPVGFREEVVHPLPGFQSTGEYKFLLSPRSVCTTHIYTPYSPFFISLGNILTAGFGSFCGKNALGKHYTIRSTKKFVFFWERHLCVFLIFREWAAPISAIPLTAFRSMTVEINDITVQETTGNWEAYKNELILRMNGGNGSGKVDQLNDQYLYYPDSACKLLFW